MVKTRRRGVAIVDTKNGILVVADKSKTFMLPGGGAERWESRRRATIRELYEETGLKTKKITYLFKYAGNKWHNHNNKSLMNLNKVFLVEVEGTPKPSHEIKFIRYWTPKSKIKLTSGAKESLKRYIKNYKLE